MKKLLDTIGKIIYEPYNETKVRTTDETVILIEEAEDAKCRKIILEKSGEALVYKFDKPVQDEYSKRMNEPFLFLDKASPIRSKCDYILFYIYNGIKGTPSLIIFVCNMKSGQKSNMEDQLASGMILSEFLVKTAIRCYDSWESQTSNNVKTFNKEAMIYIELAIYSKLPPSLKTHKGLQNPSKNFSKRKNLDCNKSYNLDRLIFF